MTLLALAVLAYHDTQGGDSVVPLVLFVGAAGTVAWLLLSRLRWRNTVLVAATGWVVGLALTFGL